MTNCEIFAIGDADCSVMKKIGNRPIKEADTDFFQIHLTHALERDMHTNYQEIIYGIGILVGKKYHL